MPVVIGAVRRRIDANHAGGPTIVEAIEKEQLDSACVLGVDAEVRTFRRNGRAQRRTPAFGGFF